MSKLFEQLTELAKVRGRNVGVYVYPNGKVFVQLGFGEVVTGDEAQIISKLTQLLLKREACRMGKHCLEKTGKAEIDGYCGTCAQELAEQEMAYQQSQDAA